MATATENRLAIQPAFQIFSFGARIVNPATQTTMMTKKASRTMACGRCPMYGWRLGSVV